jgi:3-oxoacyl-[acyl-carrier protein] reductase
MAKTAIITGASGGIGSGITRRLAQDGFQVVVHYSGKSDKADEAVAAVKQAGGNAISCNADISKPEEVKALFQTTKQAFGSVDVVVHTAGIMPLAPIAQGDLDSFDKVIAVNLRGSYLVMSEAANEVIEGGRIIVFSSSVVEKNFPGYGAYIASKAGVEGLTHVLANELGQKKIAVNAIAPGPVSTPLFLKDKSKEQLDQMAKMVPFGRIGEVDDIAGVISFLAGPDSEWINGQVIRVNGGFV